MSDEQTTIIKNKKAVLCFEDKCSFKWSILASVFPVSANANRITSYKAREHELNFEGIRFPSTLRDVPVFEKQNKNIEINVYAGVPPNVKKIYATSRRNCLHHIDLFKFSVNFGCIRNLKRLLGKSGKRTSLPCDYCDSLFRGQEEKAKHISNH